MTMGSLFIILLIFILSGVIVLRPIFNPKGRISSSHSGRYDVLLAEKERVYSIIEELDQSLDLQKISPEDHSKSRDELLNQAALILAELDKIGGKKKTAKKSDPSSKSDDELEKMIQDRRESLKLDSRQVCPNCGGSVTPKDQFCSKCGESL